MGDAAAWRTTGQTCTVLLRHASQLEAATNSRSGTLTQVITELRDSDARFTSSALFRGADARPASQLRRDAGRNPRAALRPMRLFRNRDLVESESLPSAP